MKKCSKCGEVKPLTEFYAEKLGKMGKRSKCIDCFNRQVKDRLKTETGKHAHSSAVKSWRNENEIAKTAHDKVNKALKKGIISKLPCYVCGDKKSEAHHEDYSQPLSVVWMCRLHHKARHKEMKKCL